MTETTATMLIGFIFVVGGWILKAVIEHSVKSEFDGKLEVLRASLKARDAELDAIRAGALAAMRDRHANLDKRRLQAAERLAENIASNGKLKYLARLMQSIKVSAMFDVVERGGQEAASIGQFADQISEWGGINEFASRKSVNAERVFVSPIVWALFTTYNLALLHPVAQVMILKTRLGRKMLADPKPTIDAVRAALPHQTAFIEQYGEGAIVFLIDELEEKLLKALIDSLVGDDVDDQAVKQAAKILALTDIAAAKPLDAPAVPAGFTAEIEHVQPPLAAI